MNWISRLWNLEPVVIVGIAGGILAVAVDLGAPISAPVKADILTLLPLVWGAIAFVVRNKVLPVAKLPPDFIPPASTTSPSGQNQ